MTIDRKNLSAITHLRVLHVISGLQPAHGGPSYSVPRLCEALARHDAAITLLSVGGSNENLVDSAERSFEDKRFQQNGTEIPAIGALRLSFGLCKELRKFGPHSDIIHNHGLWLAPNIYAAKEARRTGKPLIVSPRGMLSPASLSYSRLKKKFFWLAFQEKAVRNAACIHATSHSEYEDVRALGLPNPVAVIPNGIDIPETSKDINGFNPEKRILLALGRIHPKKSLDRLLHAWRKVESTFPNWQLRIVGPAEMGHEKELKSLIGALALQSVTIEGAIFGDEKNAAFREADLFVLPSFNENFGLTVAESLANGTAVISSKGAPWSGLEAEGCGWWVDNDVEPLVVALTNAMSMPRKTLSSMGAKGRAWMKRDFSWDSVATEMLKVYEWLIAGGITPATIKCD